MCLSTTHCCVATPVPNSIGTPYVTIGVCEISNRQSAIPSMSASRATGPMTSAARGAGRTLGFARRAATHAEDGELPFRLAAVALRARRRLHRARRAEQLLELFPAGAALEFIDRHCSSLQQHPRPRTRPRRRPRPFSRAVRGQRRATRRSASWRAPLGRRRRGRARCKSKTKGTYLGSTRSGSTN